MHISKKELLSITGISYGQLYRWKREKLIPEDWFIKQSSFTGQETFFPREKILNRVKAIQDLKDKYTLEELSKILSPEVADKSILLEDLPKITEINSELVDAFRQGFDKDNFTYIEVIIMIAISELKKEKSITSEQVIGLIRGMNVFLDRIKSTSYMLVILDQNSNYYANLYQEQAQVFMDSRFSVVKEIRLDEISNQIKIKYQNKYNFLFDEVNNEE